MSKRKIIEIYCDNASDEDNVEIEVINVAKDTPYEGVAKDIMHAWAMIVRKITTGEGE